jgi:hypothetical protein
MLQRVLPSLEILTQLGFSHFGLRTISNSLAHTPVQVITQVSYWVRLGNIADFLKDLLAVLALLLWVIQQERFRFEIVNLMAFLT